MDVKIPHLDKRIVFVLVIIILSATIYFVFFRMNAGKAYKILGKKSYQNLGDKYVIARAKAIKGKNETFTLDGKNYLTETGKSAS